MITLRPALSADYSFALSLYVQTIKPLATAWMAWVDREQEAQFASLWRPDDTWIITLNGHAAAERTRQNSKVHGSVRAEE